MPEGGGMAYRVPSKRKKRKPSPVERALADLGQDVASGGKKAARKVATPEVNKRAQALQDRGAAVRTFGPLARQPTFTERASAKSEQMARKRARLKRKRLSAKKHEVDPLAKGVRRGIRSVEDALRLLDEPEELPDYYRKTMRPKTVRAIERHVARMPEIERAEREALRKTKTKGALEDVLEELPVVKLGKVSAKVLSSGAEQLPKVLAKVKVKPVSTGGPKLPLAIVGASSQQKRGTKEAKVASRFVKDIAGLPVNIPVGVAKVGHAGYKATPIPGLKKSDTRELKEIVDQTVKHDPLILAARGKFKEAGKEIEKHPGLAALEVYGAGAGLSRAASIGARSGAAGSKARTYASLERHPRTDPGTKQEYGQRYSKGLAAKRVQVRGEKTKVKRAKELYREAGQARARGDNAGAQQLRRHAQKENPFRATSKDLNARYDRREGLAEPRRRDHRDELLERVDAVLPKKHAGIALLIAQHIVEPTRKGLEEYLGDLSKEHKNLNTKSQKIANEQTRKQIREALDDDDLDMGALADAAKGYTKIVSRLQREMVRRGILPKEAAKKAKLVPVAVREMGARWNAKTERLELDGQEVTTKQIEGFLRSTGRDPKRVAYVSHRPSQNTAGAYYSAWQEPKGIGADTRTGEATRGGTFTADQEAGRANAARMQTLIDAHDEYQGFVREFGYKGKGGKGKPGQVRWWSTRGEAQKALREVHAAGNKEWVAVSVRPLFGKGAQARQLLDAAQETLHLDSAEAVKAALRGDDGAPKYVLVPKVTANRMQEHMKVLDPTAAGKALRLMNRQFVNTVLTTKTSWPFGNVAEASLRSFAVKAGPGSYKLGRETLKRLERIDPKMAEELMHRIGTGHLGMRELQIIHTTAKMFEDTAFEGVANAMAVLRRTPGPKQVADVWAKYTRFVFAKNGLLEKQFKVAMLGRYAKDVVIPERGLRDLETAAQEAARGLKGTDAQFAAGEWIRRAYGAYDGFSPSGRKIKLLYTPFGAWTVNAARFILDVLPRDHPVFVGLMAAQDRALEQWRKDVALDILPDWLKGSIPGTKSWSRWARYTPFSLAADPLGTGAGMVIPQFSGILNNAVGLDWRNKPLNDHESTEDVSKPERIKAILGTLFGETVPFLSTAQTLARKEGGIGTKVLRTLNPVDPIPRQGAEAEKAFHRDNEIRKELDKLPALEDMKEGSPRWMKRKKLNAERAKLQGRIYKLTKKKYGKKPTYSPPSTSPPGLSGGGSNAIPPGLSPGGNVAIPPGL